MTKRSLAHPLPDLAEDEIEEFDFSEPSESVLYEAIQEAIDDLASQGQIVDSGLRRWSRRTGRYEIVWMVPPGKRIDGEACKWVDSSVLN